MGELLEECPGAALTLYSRFGVGSRDKLGFRPDQPLRQVLARHLLFDVEAVLRLIREREQAQRQFLQPPAEFARGSGVLVDCRSQQEHERLALPGSRLLTASLVAELAGQPLRLFDQRGPMAAAAAVHLAGKGFPCRVLDGGLRAWSREVDPFFPLYDDGSSQDPIRILPGWRQVRLSCEFREGRWEGQPALVPFPCSRLWRSRDYLAVLIEEGPVDWLSFCREVAQWMPASHNHPWVRRAEPQWEPALQDCLREEVQPTLLSHKGVVELVECREGVAHVRLGGGCQGCSSAAVTVNQEIAAMLWNRLPELEGVVDASLHEDPAAQPHH